MYLFEDDFADGVFHARVCKKGGERFKRTGEDIPGFGRQKITDVKLEILDGQFKGKLLWLKVEEDE